MSQRRPFWGTLNQEMVSPPLSHDERTRLCCDFGVQCDANGLPTLPRLKQHTFERAIGALGRLPDSSGGWVIDAIDQAARHYIFVAGQEIRAPRDADRRDTLKELRTATEHFVRLWTELDTSSFNWLVANGVITEDEGDAIFAGADPGWINRPDVIANAMPLAINNLPKDHGGRGKTVMHRSAKYRLVADCVAIAHFWDPSIISTAERKSGEPSLREFVSIVYEIATGEEEKDLYNDLKKVVKKYRKLEKEKHEALTKSLVSLISELILAEYASAWSIFAAAADELSPD